MLFKLPVVALSALAFAGLVASSPIVEDSLVARTNGGGSGGKDGGSHGGGDNGGGGAPGPCKSIAFDIAVPAPSKS